MSIRKDIPHPSHGELFYPDALPFNLAGELLDNSTTSEGEARVRALAESEARKAQTLIFCDRCGVNQISPNSGQHCTACHVELWTPKRKSYLLSKDGKTAYTISL